MIRDTHLNYANASKLQIHTDQAEYQLLQTSQMYSITIVITLTTCSINALILCVHTLYYYC